MRVYGGHKVCPRCSAPVVLSATQCGQCGYLCRTQCSPGLPVPTLGQEPIFVAGGSHLQPARRVHVGPLLVALTAALAATIALHAKCPSARLVSVAGTSTTRIAPVAGQTGTPTPSNRSPMGALVGRADAPSLATGPLTNLAPAAGAGPGPGPFTEATSRTETPTIVVTNGEGDHLVFMLSSGYRVVCRLEIAPYGVGSVRVMPGQYDYRVVGTDPHVGAGYGDATFRRYREYRATFVNGTDFGPQHLGD